MTTRTGVTRTNFQAPKRDWLLGLHGTEGGMNPTATLDLSALDAGGYAPNGYVPSGTVVSRVASGLWGPFDSTATGLEHGITIGDVAVDKNNLTQDAATGVLKHGAIAYAKLPTVGRPTAAALRTALPQLDVADVTP